MTSGRAAVRVCLCLLLSLAGGGAVGAEDVGLAQQDCVKCHAYRMTLIAAVGGKHASELRCVDCHRQHPPQEIGAVLDCNACHVGTEHDRAGNCLYCHAEPHNPLASLRDPLKPARAECITCHVEIGRQMAAAPSRHAELYCNRCHRQHRERPDCLECHPPHLPDQQADDCRLCHPAHRPKEVVPVGHTPSRFCRACHIDEGRALAMTGTRHGAIDCVYCHGGAHRSSAACLDCHGLPHAKSIHARHQECLACHLSAHRLISRF